MSQKIENVLISLSDKSDIEKVLKVLKKYKINIISSGGTYKDIIKLGYSCTEISKYTNFNEMLDVEPINRAIKNEDVAAYETNDFWRCVDSKRDLDFVRSLWDQGNASWIV